MGVSVACSWEWMSGGVGVDDDMVGDGDAVYTLGAMFGYIHNVY